jgi:outer membrane immunogenic protein
MRRLGLGLLATTALATCGAGALAGNSAVTPPYHAPAPVFDPWMGWYAGANIGGSWGRSRSDFGISGFATSISASDSVTPDGVIGGGQLGYNWRLDPNWLIGAEADIQASGEKASGGRFDTVDFEGVTTNYETKIEWFGTVRGRLGYVFDRRILLYATGGLAYGRVSISGTSTDTFGIATLSSTAFSNSNVNTGWTAGGGVEAMGWDPRWTWKVEYLYLDLGTLDAAVSSQFIKTHSTSKFTDHVVRGGLNFHF